jgi:hypothetical protein
MTSSNHEPDPARCPLCGRSNQYQLASDAACKGPCWCEKAEIPEALLAQVPAESRDKSCICHDCVTTFRSRKYKTAGAPAVEPGDFYFDGNGLMVFTAAYLRRRGFCCDSGCRHCPYKPAKTS